MICCSVEYISVTVRLKELEEITNMFSKDSLQSIKTPSRLTDDSEVYNDF